MLIKNVNLFDSKGNEKGTYDVFMSSDILFEFFYPKSTLKLDKNDEILISLHNDEEMYYKVISY